MVFLCLNLLFTSWTYYLFSSIPDVGHLSFFGPTTNNPAARSLLCDAAVNLSIAVLHCKDGKEKTIPVKASCFSYKYGIVCKVRTGVLDVRLRRNQRDCTFAIGMRFRNWTRNNSSWNRSLNNICFSLSFSVPNWFSSYFSFIIFQLLMLIFFLDHWIIGIASLSIFLRFLRFNLFLDTCNPKQASCYENMSRVPKEGLLWYYN